MSATATNDSVSVSGETSFPKQDTPAGSPYFTGKLGGKLTWSGTIGPKKPDKTSASGTATVGNNGSVGAAGKAILGTIKLDNCCISDIKASASWSISSDGKASVGVKAASALVIPGVSWFSLPFEGSFNVLSIDRSKWANGDFSSAEALTVMGGSLATGVSLSLPEPVPLDALGLPGKFFQGNITFMGSASWSPNWAFIWGQMVARGAQTAAEGSAETVVAAAAGGEAGGAGAAMVTVDAILPALGAVGLPLAFAALAGYGIISAQAAGEVEGAALAMGEGLRQQAKDVSDQFAAVLLGQKGAGPGAEMAENQISMLQGQTNASRDVIIQGMTQTTNAADLANRERLKLLNLYFDKAVTDWEAAHQADFGLTEKLGPTWGLRGAFRKGLRLSLFWNDA